MRSLHLLAVPAFVAWFACGGDTGTKTGADSGSVSDAGNTADATKPRPSDRSDLTDVGATAELDYSDPRLWLCGPDSSPDECARSLVATEFKADGTRAEVTHPTASAPPFDCFYVYPTVEFGAAALMTNFANVDKVLDPLLSQAAWFRSVCKVHAPLYRQISLALAGGPNPLDPAALTRGIADLRSAFRYFLDHHSKGRKFVLIAHSQGTATLSAVIRSEIDDDPALRARLISAVLIGGNVTTAVGQRTGGSFQNIPTCSAPGEVGCVIAYSSFAKESPPTSASLFGRTTAGLEVVCTEPAALAGNSGRYRGTYGRTTVTNPSFKPDGVPLTDVATPFVLYRDYFRGQCRKSEGAHYLEVSADPPAGDLRAPFPYRSALLEAGGFGLHIVDFNLELEDLLEAVRLQAATALRP